MMTKPKSQAYARRFNRVLDYIDSHLDEPVTVEVLSAVANFSKFHFHRQFSDYIGLPVGRYVQLMKLRRASQRLVFNPDARIIDIALDAGFDSPEAFARAFKAAFDQTPSDFRKAPQWGAWSLRYQFQNHHREGITEMDVQIVTEPDMLVAALEHKGSPGLLPAAVQQFIGWRRETGLSPVTASKTLGIAYHDPDLTPPDEFRFDICGTVATAVPDNPQGIVTKTIPGGRCAMAHYVGSRDHIGRAVYYLYRSWLPMSGEELRDFSVYFEYLNLDHETPAPDHETRIYLPLADRSV
ncbi:AraC family transcriptional regulator [Allorhizobium taibaishanense]|uniref:AraC family transcriptional regulator n=2 Tax=Allorhizobium taibaishanense TaxID=887144 RepID=A0A7W6MSN5_9HYPH|nr:AraC family transcriptional regulator [Allorhizobium taibaishanense]MBB4006315.1 AraC family transcriptional regulator [Allorhizobium taibaishanense]